MREDEYRPAAEEENMETKKAPEGEPAARESEGVPETWEKFGEVPAEVGREVRAAKETLAEQFWGGAAGFAENAASGGLAKELGPFLKRFAELGDREIAGDKLRASRDRVARGLEAAG